MASCLSGANRSNYADEWTIQKQKKGLYSFLPPWPGMEYRRLSLLKSLLRESWMTLFWVGTPICGWAPLLIQQSALLKTTAIPMPLVYVLLRKLLKRNAAAICIIIMVRNDYNSQWPAAVSESTTMTASTYHLVVWSVMLMAWHLRFMHLTWGGGKFHLCGSEIFTCAEKLW